MHAEKGLVAFHVQAAFVCLSKQFAFHFNEFAIRFLTQGAVFTSQWFIVSRTYLDIADSEVSS